MSDERKKWSRVRPALVVLLLFVLYPLSMGPTIRLAIATDRGPHFIRWAYWPLLQMANRYDAPGKLLADYIRLWAKSDSRIDYISGQGIGFAYKKGTWLMQFWSADPPE
jgi:hypothetical protein